MPAVRRGRTELVDGSPKIICAASKPTKRASLPKTILTAIKNGPHFVKSLLFDVEYALYMCSLLFLAEIFICTLVVLKVPYTEIDWKAYMEQVEQFVGGNWNYSQLNGGTGPLVYPAGHLYIYTALYYLTALGKHIIVAECIFAAMYLLNLLLVFRIYLKWNKLPPYAYMFMTVVAYRIHSIYMLRLFNDSIAMLLLYAAVNLCMDNYWLCACVVYSLSVSIKMNVLLFCPAVGYIMVYAVGWTNTALYAAICALIQVLLGLPFLATDPVAYLGRSFNLGRIFLFEWTVNWRFLPETVFVDRRFHVALLLMHILVLAALMLAGWIRRRGGIINFFTQKERVRLQTEDILLCFFSANLVGIAFCRSLHYQFYVWYYHSLPFLLWTTKYPPVVKICILGIVEMCWNTYPSTVYSSAALHCMHALMLAGLFHASLSLKGEEKKQL